MADEGKLAELLARVEAAEGPKSEIDARLWCALVSRREYEPPSYNIDGRGRMFHRGYNVPKYTASLDAAHELVQQALPEDDDHRLLNVSVALRINPSLSGRPCGARITFYDRPFDIWSKTISDQRDHASSGANPALALCAALLKALIANERKT